ncbi:MAG: type II toxin-antitoxin system RelE/ParE family toxin [Nitrospiraceae bacterium]
MMLIRYHEAAEEELLNEIGYLEARTQGLGRRFFAEVQRAEKRIAQFPESAEEIQPGIRKLTLRTFRYALMYALQPNSALVLAVAHHNRRPGYWIGR